MELTVEYRPGAEEINVGDPALMAGMGDTPAADQDGRPRVVDGRIDMGAIEYNANGAPTLASAITEAEVEEGDPINIDLDDFFSDPDGILLQLDQWIGDDDDPPGA